MHGGNQQLFSQSTIQVFDSAIYDVSVYAKDLRQLPIAITLHFNLISSTHTGEDFVSLL